MNLVDIFTRLAIVVIWGTISLPANADEIEDLKRQIQILANKIEILEKEMQEDQQVSEETVDTTNAVTAGAMPGSIKLPGTETSLKIGGFIQTSLIYDLGPRPTSRGGDIASARSAILEDEPEYNNRGDVRISARHSRFNLETLTPTVLGRLKTFIEGDFNGPPHNKANRATTNRTAFGIRHAYAELGNFLIGQYWSIFSNNSAFPDKVDGTGPVGRTFMRQNQIRYTHHFGSGSKLAIALENPRGDFKEADDHNLDDSYPDLTAHYRYETDRWHMQFSGMLRRMGINEGSLNGARDHITSWGLNQSGAFYLQDSQDRISWYIAFGNGIGRYIDGIDQGASVTPEGKLDNQFGFGGFVTYRHWWTRTLSSNIDFGYSVFDLNPEEVGHANHKLYSSHINLMWSPIKEIELGVEYVWAHRKVFDGREGSINRINALSVFYF